MAIRPSSSSNFYINPKAIRFEFNALGDPDNVSVSVYHDAKVTAYSRYIPDLGYTPSDEFHKWTLAAFPTHFTDVEGVARYCHVAVQRTGTNATVVYPPHRLDILGRHISDDGSDFLDDNGNVITVSDDNSSEPAEDENFFYFFIGKISASEYGTKNRDWTDDSYPVFGILDTARYHEDDLMREIDALRAYIDSNLFFERYPIGDPFEVMETDPVTGELVPKQEHSKDADGNLLYYTDQDSTGTTTEPTEWPVLQPVINDNTAIRLKTKFLGLFSEGWMSAYGINADGTGYPGGGGGGGFMGDRLDEWSKYDASKPQVLGANLGVELHDTLQRFDRTVSASLADLDARLRKIKVIVDFSELTGQASFEQLPALYWADQLITAAPTTEATPTVKTITIGGATLSWDATHQCLVSDKGIVSESFVSAYGINDKAQSAGANVASQTWGDGTYTAENAAPANLTAEKINALVKRVEDLENGGAITEITSKMVTDALGYTPLKKADLTYANLPALYIGTTRVQSTSQSQALTGITTIAATGNNTITKSTTDSTSFTATNTNGSIGLVTHTNRGVYDNTKSKWLIATDGTSTWFEDGYIGINTTTPKVWLDVKGNTRVNGSLYLTSTYGDIATSTPRIWYDETNKCLRTNVGFVSDSFVSAYGVNGNSGGGSIVGNRLDKWTDYTAAKSTWVLSAALGYELYSTLNGPVATSLADLDARVNAHTRAFVTVATSLADLDARIKAVADDPGEILTFPVSGSGNAVTNITKSGTVVSVTKGATFLTEHQSLAAYMKTADFTKQSILDKIGTSTFVSSLGGKTGAVTVRGSQTANGSVNLTMSNNDLQASIVGLQALAFKASLAKADVGLGNVENTALSTWKGTANITTLGTITSGTWHGSKIANAYLENNSMTLWGNTVALGGSTNGSITIKNGSKSVTLSVDTSGYLKVDAGLYSTSFVSAYGANGSSPTFSSVGFGSNGKIETSGSIMTVSNLGMGSTLNINSYYTTMSGYSTTLEGAHTSVKGTADLSMTSPAIAIGDKDTTNTIDLITKGTGCAITLHAPSVLPNATDSVSLGSSSVKFSYLYVTNIGSSSSKVTSLYVTNIGSSSSKVTSLYASTTRTDTIYVNNQQQHSDMRLKEVLSDVRLSVSDIANAPSFRYRLKGKSDIIIGSSAQYWREILPDAVIPDPDGWLSLNYTSVTMASVVALAKQSESHEKRIKRLERENKELKKKIVELEKN